MKEFVISVIISFIAGNDAWYRGLSKNAATIDRRNYTKTYGFSARCVKD
jgi:hypothetical protein